MSTPNVSREYPRWTEEEKNTLKKYCDQHDPKNIDWKAVSNLMHHPESGCRRVWASFKSQIHSHYWSDDEKAILEDWHKKIIAIQLKDHQNFKKQRIAEKDWTEISNSLGRSVSSCKHAIDRFMFNCNRVPSRNRQTWTNEEKATLKDRYVQAFNTKAEITEADWEEISAELNHSKAACKLMIHQLIKIKHEEEEDVIILSCPAADPQLVSTSDN